MRCKLLVAEFGFLSAWLDEMSWAVDQLRQHLDEFRAYSGPNLVGGADKFGLLGERRTWEKVGILPLGEHEMPRPEDGLRAGAWEALHLLFRNNSTIINLGQEKFFCQHESQRVNRKVTVGQIAISLWYPNNGDSESGSDGTS